jgi:hypothetical protein
MGFTKVGKADRNSTVEEVMAERPRTGGTHIDLVSGDIVKYEEIQKASLDLQSGLSPEPKKKAKHRLLKT